jgi:hypothetical protein
MELEIPSNTTVSVMSATEYYQPPEADRLASLLRKGDAVRSWTINSRESTPLRFLSPRRVEDQRSDALKTRKDLARLIGKVAAEETRRSIPHTHYWKTEADHYATYWSKFHMALAKDAVSFFHPMTAEDVRQLISDGSYWEAEVRHYENRYRDAYHTYALVQISKSTNSTKRPSGIRKRRNARGTSPKSKNKAPSRGWRRSQRIIDQKNSRGRKSRT